MGPYAEFKRRHPLPFLVAAAVCFAVALLPKVARGGQDSPPCDYSALEKAHIKSHDLWLEVIGKPHHPEYLTRANKSMDVFVAQDRCKEAINRWEAPMELKRAALGLPPDKPRVLAGK